MKAFAAFLNLVVAVAAHGVWRSWVIDGWVDAYIAEIPDEYGWSEADRQEIWYALEHEHGIKTVKP